MDEVLEKELAIRRLKYNEVNFEVTFEGPPNYSKTYFMNIFRCFNHHTHTHTHTNTHTHTHTHKCMLISIAND